MTDAEIVEIAPGRLWHALADGEVVGRAEAITRPDARVFVAVDAWRPTVAADLLASVVAAVPRDLASMVGADDAAQLAVLRGAGFRRTRREVEVVVPVTTGLAATQPGRVPDGVVVRPAQQTDPVRLCELDEQLRSDLPGAAGWVNDFGDFLALSLDPRFVAPDLHLVAVAEDTDAYLGLIRVSRHPRTPRLAALGVVPAARRRGLARALVHRALLTVASNGITALTAEVDTANVAAWTLIRSLGARQTGEVLEVVRPAGRVMPSL